MSTNFSANSPLEAALLYAEQGIPVIPLHHVSFTQSATIDESGVRTLNKIPICSCKLNENCTSIAKHPKYHKELLNHGLLSASTDPIVIKKWFNQWPQANVAILAGKKSGFIVIDIDPRHGGDLSLIELQSKNQNFPETLTETTGSGGKHILFEYPELTETQEKEIRNSASAVAPGIDVKVEGGYIVCSPSIHATGQRYHWDNPGAGIAKLPNWFLELMLENKTQNSNQNQNNKSLPKFLNNIGTGYSEGGRNDLLFREISAWQNRGVPDNVIEGLALKLNETACLPPLNENEVVKIVTSVINRYEKGPEIKIPLTDLGNGERLSTLHKNKIAWCEAHGGWQIWTGKYWKNDNGCEVKKFAHHTARNLSKEINMVSDPVEKEKIGKWARASESISKTNAMIEQAKPYLLVNQELFDADNYLLNCENGIVDLKTGELLIHDQEKYCRKICPVIYDENAPEPTNWINFLNLIFDYDSELILFIQQSLGYSLTGDVSAQCLFFLHGTGANGKSTFIETIAEMMGEYHYKTAAELLMITKNPQGGSSASPDIASLQGSRMVTASELDSGRRFSESKIKDLTGGDTIKARRLFCNEFNFKPTHKLWLFGNNKPTIRDTDPAIWRRIRLIPFNVMIPEADRLQNFREKYLMPELPGILRWAVHGCLDWQSAGVLFTPESVKRATSGFREEMDLLGNFLSECCKTGDFCSIKASVIYDCYKKWSESNGEYAITGTKFGKELASKNFAKKHTMYGTVYTGITTLNDEEDAENSAYSESSNISYSEKLKEL